MPYNNGSQRGVGLTDISIIIPTYNRAARLVDLLDQWVEIDQKTKADYELIFSDDGSSDNSIEILESYQHRLPLIILKNAHGGASAARNSGVEAASGERVLFLGDDIYPNHDLVDLHVELGKKLGKKVAILGKVDWHPDQHLNHVTRHITDIGNEQFSFNCFKENGYTDFRHFYTCNVSVSRELLNSESVVFDRRFYKVNFEDIELAYRLTQQGMKIFYAPAAFGYHFHEYDVDGFCRRQMMSGEMGNVFVALHPEIDDLLKLSELRLAYENYIAVNGVQTVDASKLGLVLDRCKMYEAIIEDKQDSVIERKILSAIYTQLFKLKFCEGGLSGTDSFHQITVNNFLYDRFFGEDYFNQLRMASMDALAQQQASALFPVLLRYASNLLMNKKNTEAEKNLDLLCLSLELSDKGKQLRPNIPYILKAKLWNYLRQFAILRRLRFFLRQISPSWIKKQVAVRSSGKGLLPTVAVLVQVDLPDELIQNYQVALGEGIRFFKSVSSRYIELGGKEAKGANFNFDDLPCTHFLEIDLPSELPLTFHLRSVLLCFATYGYDYVLVSYSYKTPPAIGMAGDKATLFLSKEMLTTGKPVASAVGRVLRLMPAPTQPVVRDQRRLLLESSFRGNVIFASEFSPRKPSLRAFEEVVFSHLTYNGTKPVVFVFPIFMAVGGAERNIIEVMKKLKDKYHFVVIPMEPHNEGQGSLHHQLLDITDDIYDLAEIADFDDYFNVLKVLKKQLNPGLLLITNGSPWLLANSSGIRNLFRDIPIIDHQVYDQKEGWIEHYQDKGIQSFDHFVAINKKIEQVMINDKGIVPGKITQIYSTVNTDRIEAYNKSPGNPAAICERFGLPIEADKYLFMARLSDQKRPLDFLELVRKRQAAGSKEVFVMVGDGELRREVAEFINAHQLKNIIRIEFVEDTPGLISVCKGMLFTSQYEGLPIAMLEALAGGVPVHSTDVGDVKLVLDEFSAGVTVPVDSTPSDYEQSFASFLLLRDVLAENLRTAKVDIAKRFCPDTIAGQYDQLFVRALAEARSC